MASPPVLDLDALLAPIAESPPTGIDVRATRNKTWSAVKEARKKAREDERRLARGDEEEGIVPDWRPVMANAVKVIGDIAKDLEAVAFLLEALVRLHGFAGARDGFRLAHGLIERYWDDLHPKPEEDDPTDPLELKVGSLSGLNGTSETEGTLPPALQRVPLTEGRSAGPFRLFQYKEAAALRLVQDEEARDRKIQQGATAPAAFDTAVRETSASFFTQLVEDIGQALEEFARLGALLDEKCGPGLGPSTSAIRGTLTECLEAVRSFARDRLATSTPAAPAGAPSAAPGAVTEAVPGGAVVAGVATAVGDIRTRDDALQALLKVADFFRRNEPHTPVSYAVEQAVRWGRMPLPELLRELIPDTAAQEQFFRQVGIRDVPSP